MIDKDVTSIKKGYFYFKKKSVIKKGWEIK